jgi:excisionase family DNA binding protein
MAKTKDDDLITQTEAAQLRGVSRASISELVRRGRLNAVEMYGRKLVRRSEVIAFEPQTHKSRKPVKSKKGKAKK